MLPQLESNSSELSPSTLSKTNSCSTLPLTKIEAEKFSEAIRKRWYYDILLDGLPSWHAIGTILPSQHLFDSDQMFGESNSKIAVYEEPLIHTDFYLDANFIMDSPGHTEGIKILSMDLSRDYRSLVKIQPGQILNFT